MYNVKPSCWFAWSTTWQGQGWCRYLQVMCYRVRHEEAGHTHARTRKAKPSATANTATLPVLFRCLSVGC